MIDLEGIRDTTYIIGQSHPPYGPAGFDATASIPRFRYLRLHQQPGSLTSDAAQPTDRVSICGELRLHEAAGLRGLGHGAPGARG